jgi:twitching motility protein PilT
MTTISRDEVVRILRESRDRGASEVHFKVPNRPLYRIDGVLLPSGPHALDPALTHQIANTLLQLAGIEAPLASLTDKEFSFGLNGVGRFQVTLYRQRGSISLILRRSGLQVPALSTLGFGIEAEDVLQGRGLVLVAGGRRRGALLASLVDRFNAAQRGCVVVLEDSLTYLHRDAMASIAQRGVGTDVESFAAGIRTAIRNHVDLLVVGEVRDRATAEAVLEAAEHGILTIASVSAPRGSDAIGWVTRNWHPSERADADTRVRRELKAVLAIPDHGAPEYVVTQDNGFELTLVGAP